MTTPGTRPGDRPTQPPVSATVPGYPVYELSVAAVRELDRRARDEFAIPTLILMENAARALREHAIELLARARETNALILCGPGANGGDGLALARHLTNLGVPTEIVLLTPDDGPGPGESASDARVNLRIARLMGIPIHGPGGRPGGSAWGRPGLIVDALFGIGLSRGPEGDAADLIRGTHEARERGSLVLSVDLPSGLCAEQGEPLGEACVRADRTVTLAAIKPGLSRLEAQAFVGDLAVADIGAPTALLAELGRPWKGFPGREPPESEA
jgi:NAD(P)H-hydrate epimerase